jgi:hypothetical protein
MDLRNPSQDKTAACSHAVESASAKELASIVQIDPKASAALASAINSAKRPVTKPANEAGSIEPVKTPDMMPVGATRKAYSHAYLSRAAVALVLIGSCGLASYAGTLASRDSIQQIGSEAARSEAALSKLSGEIEALKTELVAFRDTVNSSTAAERSNRAKLAEKIESLAFGLRNPDVKSLALEARFDRMESQIMTTLSGMASKPATLPVTEATSREAAPTPAPVPASAPAPVPAPVVKPVRNEPVNGWVVREVYDGAALVESQNRRLYEVVPGGVVPGVGRVEAIERRGRNWVVLTDKGIIGTYR